MTRHQQLPDPGAAAGWYVAPGGRVLRWWCGPPAGPWGPDVAPLQSDPAPPPAGRRRLEGRGDAPTVTLVLDGTVPLSILDGW